MAFSPTDAVRENWPKGGRESRSSRLGGVPSVPPLSFASTQLHFLPLNMARRLLRAALLLALAAVPTTLAATAQGDAFCSEVSPPRRSLDQPPAAGLGSLTALHCRPFVSLLTGGLLHGRQDEWSRHVYVHLLVLHTRALSQSAARSGPGMSARRLVLLATRPKQPSAGLSPPDADRPSSILGFAPTRHTEQTRGRHRLRVRLWLDCAVRPSFFLRRRGDGPPVWPSTLAPVARPTMSRGQTRLTRSPTLLPPPFRVPLQRLRAADGQLADGHRLAVPEQPAHVAAPGDGRGSADGRQQPDRPGELCRRRQRHQWQLHAFLVQRRRQQRRWPGRRHLGLRVSPPTHADWSTVARG
jgi:hypothetical protein